MLKTGDTVLYGTTGVCFVEGTVEREIGGKKNTYFVLRPQAKEKCTVFVPADNEELQNKARRILSRGEILNIIDSLPEKKDIWIEDSVLRRARFTEILKSGDRGELMLLIRSIYNKGEERRAENKRLYLADERLLSEAERLLHDEFSAVLGIGENEVVSFIINRLENAAK